MLSPSRNRPLSIRISKIQNKFHQELLIAMALALAFSALSSHAQVTATLLPTQITLPAPSTGLASPQQVATDAFGNVFFVDSVNNNVVEITAAGVAKVLNLGSPGPNGVALKAPRGVAVDCSNNLYVADTGNNRLIFVGIPGSGGIIQTNNNTIWNLPTGITVDCASDIFVANAGNSTVVEMPGGWGGTPALVSTATGLKNPTGITVDANYNVYVADTGNGRVMEEVSTGTAGSFSSQALVPTTGLTQPVGMAVDHNNNVYVSDATNNDAIELNVNVNPGTFVQSTISSTNLLNPQGVAVDPLNNIDIADTGHRRVVQENIQPSLKLGQATVGGFGDPMVLNYSINGYTGSDYTPTFKLTYGKDVALGTTSCTGGIAPETCTVPVTLQPALSGLRGDAVQVWAQGGTPLLSDTLVYGIGNGPMSAFAPDAATIVPTTGLSSTSYGVAVDRLGNVYVSDGGNKDVIEVPVGGGAQSKLPFTGLQLPKGTAVDGAGDVYVADYNAADVVELPAGGGAQIPLTPQEFNCALLVSPAGVAVDGAGDLYIADPGADDITVVPAGTVSPYPLGSILSTTVTLKSPGGVAVDGAGDLFIADTGHSRVVEYTAAHIASVLNIGSLTPHLSAPNGIALDAAGDVYVADTGNNRVVEIAAGGGTASVLNTGSLTAPSGSSCSSTPLCAPTDVAVDGDGNIYINDTGNSRVVKVSQSAPPSLNFGSIDVGQSSAQQVVTVANIGNQNLTFSALDATTNFNLKGAGTTCSDATPLTPGATCGLGLEFAPTAAGTLSGTGNLTDDNLSAPAPNYVMQQISLSGKGVGFAATIALSESPSTSVVYGTAVTVTATLTGSNGTPTGNISYTVDGANPQTIALTSGGTAQFTLPGTLSTGTHSVMVSYAGDANYTVATPSQGFTLTVNPDATTTTLSSSANNVVYGQNVKLTATVMAGSASVTSGGTVNFFSGTTSLGAAQLNASGVATLNTTLLPVGNPDNVTASFVGSANDAASPSSPAVAITVTAATTTPAATTTTLKSSASTATEGSSVTLTATVKVTAGGALVTSGTVTFSSGTTSIGAASLGTSGVATLNTTNLPVGSDNVTASFVGSANDAASTSSPAVVIQVTAATSPSVTVTPATSTLSVAPGATVTDALTVTPVGGYTGTLQFSCTNLPVNTTCSFTPMPLTISASSGAQTVTLTIHTNTLALNSWRPLAPGQQPGSLPGNLPMLATVFWMPGWMLAAIAGGKRKLSLRAQHLMLLLLLLGGVGMMTACGGSGGAMPQLALSTPPGTSTIQVVVTGTGNLAQVLPLSLTVQ